MGSSYGYYKTCFDYSVPEVREFFLSYIEEQIMNYDVYGVEWDFTREFICFDYKNDPDCYLIMNAFMRDLRAVVDKAELKWGHQIKINARIFRDIEDDKIFGFDAEAWAKECLVTSITVCPRFEITDSNIPIPEWKELLRGTGVGLYAGLEAHSYAYTQNDTAAIAGYSRKYLDEGADRIYGFNLFYMFAGWVPEKDYVNNVIAMSSYENTLNFDNRYVVTY